MADSALPSRAPSPARSEGGKSTKTTRTAGGGDSKLESIRVVVRIRPLNSKEKAAGEEAATVVGPAPNEVTVPGMAKPFTFDLCFPPGTGQEEVYDQCASDVVAGCLDGFNGTIFACE